MDGLTLHAFRRIMFFSVEEAALYVGKVSPEAWRMYENGEAAVPEETMELVAHLLRWYEDTYSGMLGSIETHSHVAMTWYATIEDWLEQPGNRKVREIFSLGCIKAMWRPCQAVVARIAADFFGKVALVKFDLDLYSRWLDGRKDNTEMRGLWARHMSDSRGEGGSRGKRRKRKRGLKIDGVLLSALRQYLFLSVEEAALLAGSETPEEWMMYEGGEKTIPENVKESIKSLLKWHAAMFDGFKEMALGNEEDDVLDFEKEEFDADNDGCAEDNEECRCSECGNNDNKYGKAIGVAVEEKQGVLRSINGDSDSFTEIADLGEIQGELSESDENDRSEDDENDDDGDDDGPIFPLLWFDTVEDWLNSPGATGDVNHYDVSVAMWRSYQSAMALAANDYYDELSLVKFDSKAYAKWLGGREDTDEMRVEWTFDALYEKADTENNEEQVLL